MSFHDVFLFLTTRCRLLVHFNWQRAKIGFKVSLTIFGNNLGELFFYFNFFMISTHPTVQRLLFADDLVLLDSTQNGLQQAVDRFSDACSVAGMKISKTITKTMCLSRLPKQCSLQIDGVPLKQSQKLKYLGVSFTGGGRRNSELDIRIGKASAVMRQLHAPIFGTETGALHQGKAIHFRIRLCSYSDLWL